MPQSRVAPSAALRTLVAGVVDYAGLFPPAGLDMPAAVRHYAECRAGDDAWMLGRFVVQAARLDEWESAVAALPHSEALPWNGARLSALLTGEFSREAELINTFNARAPSGVQIDVAEGRAATPDAVLAMAAAMPDEVMLYAEVSHRDDPQVMLQAVREAAVRAKIRTGGVTPDAFPQPAEIVRFLRRCHELGVTAKATAGLHHPLRGEFRLTYATDAVRGMMYGYLNVFLAAAAIRAGATDAVASEILVVTDPSVISVAAESLTVCGILLDAAVLAATRESGLVAFGSCSFREPVDELTAFDHRYDP